MNNELTIKVKTVYGVETIYPECDKSKTFCKLLNQKTLTRENINNIKQLGFTFNVKSVALTI